MTRTTYKRPSFVLDRAQQECLKQTASSLNWERRKAECKRARLEAMYQSHLISSAAYKKGQDEYQSGIASFGSRGIKYGWNKRILTD